MIKHLQTSYIQRQFIKKNELKILLLKNIMTLHHFINNSNILRYVVKEIYLTFKSVNSRSRMNSICVLTGRTRSVYRKVFKTTRMQLREKTNLGLHTGIRKSS
jgi:ribosomal protein S14